MFVRTAASGGAKWTPLDPEPDERGRVELRVDAERNWRVAVAIGPKNPPTEGAPLYVPHWASCPNADRHRRRG
jgi:hypothetical protein